MNAPKFEPIHGKLVRAGFMRVNEEDSDGLFVSVTEDELRAVKSLPMYHSVVVIERGDYEELCRRNEELEHALHKEQTNLPEYRADWAKPSEMES